MRRGEASGRPSSYRADIDGLRAVAVLLVIGFHYFPERVPGGYIGVDVFFVISGYLIASIIRREIAGGTFSLADFWERRARRIVPAVAVVCLVTAALVLALYLPDDLRDFAQSFASLTLLSSNHLFLIEAGYFDTRSELKPLLHTWSLSIEEQFYVLLPLLLLPLARHRGRSRLVLPLLVALTLGSFALCVWLTSYQRSVAFYLLPARAWELGVGVCLAWLPSERRRVPAAFHQAAGVLGLLLILLAAFLFDERTVFPGVAAALPCLGALLVIAAGEGRPDSLSRRLLARRVPVAIGLVSYSLYLWHWPLVAVARYVRPDGPGTPVLLALFALSAVLAAASYRYVEQPVRRGARLRSRGAVLAGVVGFIALSASTLLLVQGSGGLPQRFDPAVTTMAAGFTYTNPRRGECLFSEHNRFEPDKACRLGETGSDAPAPSFALIGDSHANSVMPVFDELALRRGVSGLFLAYNGCPPGVGLNRADVGSSHRCSEFMDSVRELVTREGLEHVLLVGRWSYYLEEDNLRATAEAFSRECERRPADSTASPLFPGVESLINGLPTGTAVWILRQVPKQSDHVSPRSIAVRLMRGEPIDSLGVSREEHRRHQRRADTMLDSLARCVTRDVDFLDATDALCEGGTCRLARGGGSLYRDDDHLSTYGVRAIAGTFEPFLDAVASASGR